MVTETTHVIFDFDGILVNTVDVMIDVLIDYARSHGKDLSLDIKTKVANITDMAPFFKQFVESLDLSEELDSEEVQKQMFKTIYTKGFDLIPGVKKLVLHLHKHNIAMGIATGNSKRHYSLTSRQFPDFFKHYFSHVVCGWDDPEVINKKPHPDVYLVCANRFQIKPKDIKNVLIVEDSLTGITGALTTGMKTLLINDQKIHDFEHIADKITLISDSFNNFKPETIGLPPYED